MKTSVSSSVKFVPGDMWIGVFWKYEKYLPRALKFLDIYVCAIPMLPIHIHFEIPIPY